MLHWNIIIANVLKGDFSSLHMVAIAPMHGVYNRVNTKKLNALEGLKKFPNAYFRLDGPTFSKILKVLSTVSFADKPDIKDVTILQSPKPNGKNIGVKNRLICASRLLDGSFVIFSFMVKVCKNQIIIDAMKIIEKAFSVNSFAFVYTRCKVLFSEGNL